LFTIALLVSSGRGEDPEKLKGEGRRKEGREVLLPESPTVSQVFSVSFPDRSVNAERGTPTFEV
jgi:hypothetical protein